MLPLPTRIHVSGTTADRRRTLRHELSMEVCARLTEESVRAVIHDISERGLSLQALADLKPNDRLDIELPGSAPAAARVVWTDGKIAGCEFVGPVSSHVISALRLRAPHHREAQGSQEQEESGSGAQGRNKGLAEWEVVAVLVRTAAFLWALVLLG